MYNTYLNLKLCKSIVFGAFHVRTTLDFSTAFAWVAVFYEKFIKTICYRRFIEWVGIMAMAVLII